MKSAFYEVTRQGLFDQGDRFRDAIDRHKRPETGPLGLAEQDFVEPLEPVAQIVEILGLAGGIDLVLDLRGGSFVAIHGFHTLQLVLHRGPLDIGGRTEGLGRLHEVR